MGKVGREDKCIKILAELDNIKGLGLIERKKRGQGKPTLIYMKKIMDCDDTQEVFTQELNQPTQKESEFMQGESVAFSEVEKNNFKKSEIPTSRGRENQPQEVEKNDPNNTNINKTDINKTYNPNPIYPINTREKEDKDRKDVIDFRALTREQ